MSNVPADRVVAVVCGDIHLSHRPPAARTNEPDWYAAMERHLAYLADLQAKYRCSILCAGDLFHSWREPVGLVNWALEHVPYMIVVPGQHDLPYHDHKRLKESPAYTLARTECIRLLEPGETLRLLGDAHVTGFPWGFPITPSKDYRDDLSLNIALVHAYIYNSSTGYVGASEDSHFSKWRKTLLTNGYNVGIFGDNHKPFNSFREECSIYNCGTFFRRNRDDFAMQPTVGLLYRSGIFERLALPTTEDQPMVAVDTLDSILKACSADVAPLLEQYRDLQQEGSNFLQVLKNIVNDKRVRSSVRQIILEALEVESE